MTRLTLTRELAQQVARQPQGRDAVDMAEQSGNLLDELQHYIPPFRIEGLHSATEVDGSIEAFIAQVRECLK